MKIALRASLIFSIGLAACSVGGGQPYISGAAVPDMTRVLPAAPVTGDARDMRDRAIFRATRSLQGSPRWTLAQNDADYRTPALMKDFSCALGVAPDGSSAPRLAALMTEVSNESNTIINRVKDVYKRQRPFHVDEGPTCAPAEGLDYPSGHSTLGFSMGLILTELEPDRATELLARGRAYGESRVVCGVHNASAVEAGRVEAAALVAALHGSPAFRHDLDSVRSELDSLRHGPSAKPQSCDLEAGLIATSPY
jgi:acid phosphatase (class A)